MKFTKLIKVILPIATVSGVAPFVANCGCGGNTYVINYGDNVDCINEKAKNYHKLDDVRKAIINKADRETVSSVKISDINNRVNNKNNPIGIQNFYYDLIAGSTVVEKWPLQLTDWKAVWNDEKTGYVISGKIKFDDAIRDIPSVLGTYANKDNVIWLQLGSTQVCRSYTYQNCEITPE